MIVKGGPNPSALPEARPAGPVKPNLRVDIPLDNRSEAVMRRIPDEIEPRPTLERSAELFAYRGGDWRPGQATPGVVMVEQSRGASSADAPLVSLEFAQCSAFLFRNMETGETLLVHHDSSTRSNWDARTVAQWGPPQSPCTPRRQFIHRDRTGFEAFMARPGAKMGQEVRGGHSWDRDELYTDLRAAGVRMLPPHELSSPDWGTGSDPVYWDLAFWPQFGEMVVHLRGGPRNFTEVQHFSGVLQDPAEPCIEPLDPQAEGDFIAHLENLRALAVHPDVPGHVRIWLEACLQVVDIRSYAPGTSIDALQNLANGLGVPPSIVRLLEQEDHWKKGGASVQGLARLAQVAMSFLPPGRAGEAQS